MADDSVKAIFSKAFKKVIRDDSQKTVAKKILSNQTTVSKLLNGSQAPSAEMLVQISKTYDCSVDYLLGTQKQKEEKKEYTYSDFLRIIYFLVAKKCIVIGDAYFSENVYDEDGQLRSPAVEQQTFYFNDEQLEKLVKDFGETLNYVNHRDDKEMGKKLFNAWYELELEKGKDVIHKDHNDDGFIPIPTELIQDLPDESSLD